MCGIVGYLNLKPRQHKYERNWFFEAALFLDTLRGEDSTGVFAANPVRRKGGTIEVVTKSRKTILSGMDLVKDPTWKNYPNSSWVRVGHNRAATLGSIKQKNAHPFTFGPITMVHNGTLSDKGKSLKTFDDDLDVDSAQIALALSTVEPAQAIELVNKLRGSYALVWTDARDNSFNMVRNNARPLHIGINKDRDFMMFMSDGDHLHTLNKGLRHSAAEASEVYQIDAGKHLKWMPGRMVPTIFERRSTYSGPKSQSSSASQKSAGAGTGNTANNGSTGGNRGTTGDKGKTVGPMALLPAPSSGSSSENKNTAAGDGHAKALHIYYEIEPETILRFVPDNFLQLPNSQCAMIYGYIKHPGWGYTEWPAVAMFEPLFEVEKFMDRDWTVSAVGLGKPITTDTVFSEMPSVSVRVLNWDWAGISRHGDNPNFGMDADGKLVPKYRIKIKLDAGCVSCGANLSEHKMHLYVARNNGIACEDCIWDEDE